METAEERQARKQAVLDDLNSGSITTDNEAKGQFGPTFIVNEEKYNSEKGEEWRQENDYGGTLFDRVTDQAMDIYRNMFGSDEGTLQEARKYAETMGISAQYLADNPSALEEARRINNEAIQWSFLSGQPFNAKNIDEMYPEIKRMRQADPVGASIAYQNHEDIQTTRSIFDDIATGIDAGVAQIKFSDLQFDQGVGNDNVTMTPEMQELSKRLQTYQEQEPEWSTPVNKVAYAVAQQLTQYGIQVARNWDLVAKGAILGASVAIAPSVAAAPFTAGAAVPIGVGAGALAGAGRGMMTAIFKESAKQSMAERYWDVRSRKNEFGKQEFSRGHALVDSTIVGGVSGGIEVGLLEFGFGPVTKVFGKEAGKSLLKNAAAQRKIVDAGKKELARMALQSGAIQYGRGFGSQLAEEGAQQLVSDVADNIEYGINKRGKWNTSYDVFGNVMQAMLEAAPAAIGLGAMGAGPHTIGKYNAMSHIANMRVEAWREEYQRNIETQTLMRLVENRETSKLAKEAPDVYRKVVQAQAERVGMETTYVDAQEALRKDGGAEALNDLVAKNIITEDALHQAITMGTPVEVDTATYTQMADPQTIQTLNDVSTMNKGGVHLRALKERNKRMEAIRKEFEDLASAKSDALSAEIMADHFADADDVTQAAAQDVVYRNPYDLGQSYRDALKEAREAYETAIDFNYYWTYKGDGVKVITSDANGYNNTQTGRGYRMSENEPWYSKMYKDYGGRATREQMLDVAYQDQRAEIAASAPERLAEWDDTVQAAKQKYETLRDMATTFDTLARSDYGLRKTFSKEGAKVYDDALQVFQAGNRNVAQAAKENAYIYARMAERMAQLQRDAGKADYTALDFAKAHPIRVGGKAVQKGKSYGQPITERVDLDKKIPVLTVREKYAGMDWRDLRRKLPGTVEADVVSKKNEKGEYIPYVHEQTGHKVVVTKGSLSHFKSSETSNKTQSKDRQTTLHYEMIEAVPEIIAKGIWIETHTDAHGKAVAVHRIVAPVRVGDNVYAVKVTVKKDKVQYQVEGGEYTLIRAYDVSTQKEPVAGSNSANSASKEPGFLQPIPTTDSTISIREFLQSVNDNLGKPYVNADGTPNYGIYFGDNKTGGVLYIEPQAFTQMAGPRSQTAALDTLVDAQRRFDAGEDADAIYQDTGWVRGQDGRWRYEIPDDINAIDFGDRSASTLGQVYDNPRLYAAYPELRDISVSFADTSYGGGYNPQAITLNAAYTDQQAKEALIHEVQHAIQDIEGFAVGGAPDTVQQQIAYEMGKMSRELWDVSPDGPAYVDAYTSEFNAMLAGDMTAYAEAHKTRMELEKNLPKEARQKIHTLNGLIKRLEKEWQKLDEGQSPVESYRRLHGEQEARKTAERAVQPGETNANTWQYPDPVIVFNGRVFTQRAWHGSPYEFEAFDLGAMGSGEGNQAHGWGLYFAGNKEVSEIYKEYFGWKGDHVQLNGLEYVKNRDDEWLDNTGEIIDDDTPLGFAIDALREAGTIEHAIESLNESIKNMEKRKKRMKTEKSKQYADDHIHTASQAITILQNGNGSGTKGGRLYEVEVPEQEVLLDEQKTYEEQSSYVKERLDKVIKELNDEQVERDRHDAIQAIEQLRYRSVNNITKMVNVYKSALRRLGYTEETAQKVAESDAERDKAIQEANTRYDELKAHPERLLQGRKGREIYRYLSEARSIRGDKNASLLLNENGIKGITYEGKSDGRCYVVFDEAAIQIIDRYNQSVQAAYNASTGMLHLFDTADQSSFIHEAGHLWLSELELIAARGDAPAQVMEDLQTIRQWGAYAPEQLDDYKGTEREAEFRQYAADIEAARQSGDAVAIQAAEERWMQERFARAFERYIAEGKAPVKELQGPFRRFRKWLVGIYRDLKNLGKEPQADVKRVMDRMVATDEEIEAWAKIKELNAWDRKGFSGDLSGNEGRMIAEWNEKIKADAKEKLLSQYMKDIEAEDAESLQAGLEAERIKVQEELCSENELYEYDLLYDENPDMRPAILDKLGFADEAEFKQALRNIGGTLEERTNAYMQDVSEAYVPLSPEEIRRDADERLASTDGQLALNDLEARAMNRKIKSYISECVKALREVETVSGTDAEIASQLRKLLGIETKKDKEKAVRGELRNMILSKNDQIDALKKRLAEEKETGKATQEANEKTIRSLKNALNETIRGLNRARDSVQGSYVAMLRLAREQLDEQPVSDATTWRHFEVKANTANHRADQLMSAGEFEQAVLAKGEAQRFYCLSRAAKDNQDFVRKAMQGENGRLNEDQQEIDGMMGIINRVERADKPARMNPHARYFIERLAYNAKLKDRPPRPPLDKDGNPVSLDWETIYQKLSPDYAQDKNTAPPVDEIVAPWLRQLIDGKDQVRYQDLTMAQFRDINEAIRVVYKMGRQDYETVSIVDENGQTVDLENAVAQLVGNMPRDPSWDPQQEKNNQTFRDRAQERAAGAVLDLTRSEVILQNMGPQWVQYVYRPIDKGANRELEMREEALKEFSRIHNIYSKREWYDIRNKKDYVLGGWTKVTKEQLFVLALNWGNKEGRQRVLDELNRNVTNIDQEYSEVDVEDAFSRYLTDKDLDYVEAVWAQLAQYWPERNKVQERLYGVGLGRVQPRPFTINGRKVSGGYYPIVYDSALSNRTNELELDDIARSMMSGSSTMALGMGSTKKRVAVVKNQTILKSLDVWPSAVNEAIHHICMREAVTDVNKLMSNADVERAIQENYGMQTYSTLKKWVSDCWKTDVQKQDDLSRALEIARRNTSFAVMAFRTGPAVLNALNIFPMMKQIGVLGTKQALSRFGLGIFNMGTATYHANRDFVMAHSPFMRERANTIDRDLQQAMRISVDAGEISRKVSQAKQFRDEVNRYGYKFITETDLMFSMAMWKYKYDEMMRQQIAEGKTDEAVMRDNAVFAADKAVRDVLGSGMVKDQVAMQRKGGFISQLTPFYSYSSTVLNALIHAGYQWRAGNRWEMMNAMLFWIVLPTIFETLYRSAVADEDDPEKILKRLGVGLVTSTTQGIPIVRDTLEMVGNHIFDLPNYSNNNVLGLSLVEEIGKAFSAATSENKDATDVGRSATRAVNRIAKLPDTLTDGFWALMRFSLYDTDRSVAELATAVIFDKRYRTAAERAKAEKKKQKEANKK